MQAPTRYRATLRCQTWNVWPEMSVFEADSFVLDLGEGTSVPAQAAVLSYLNRSRPEVYEAESTEKGPLVWTGTVPGVYLVRDTLLKAPEDQIQVSVEHAHARRGEIDITFAFPFDGPLPPTAHDSIRSTAFAFMSLINLRLSDFLTPVAPLHIRTVAASGSQFESSLSLAVHSRHALARDTLAPVVTRIASLLSNGPRADKLRTALELYGSHFYERQARTRFLLLVIALEALAIPTLKHQVALDLLAKWQDDLSNEQKRHDKSTAEYAALDALARDLLYRREDSIRSQIRDLFRSVVGPVDGNSTDLPRRALKIYDTRSRLVHDGSIPANDLAAAEAEARGLLELVLKSHTAT